MTSLLDQLYKALPVIAQTTGGFATVTDSGGRRLRTVDSSGREESQYDGQVYRLALDAMEKQMPVFGSSQLIGEAYAWALPIGEYVLSCSNVERVERDKNLLDALAKALPLVARVAGGEAVLFDEMGRRIKSVDYMGNDKETFIGKVSRAAQVAMEKQTPVIGESISVPGAMAVRIPIAKNYGFGFNNEVVVSQKHKLVEEMKKSQYARYDFNDIIERSENMQQCKNMAQYVAKSISSVLIYGETGTGKEMFAQAIHNASDRRAKPFIAINCSALPKSLIESNLFGYSDGAFTGAKKGGKPGIFESADHGTVFLDEISEMDMDLQVKLLRVIQEREVTRIGNTKPVPIDVRIICATNKNLRKMVEENTFREDLFYRINVVELKVPPLRNRLDDIPVLTNYFIKKYSMVLGKYIVDVSSQVLELFQSYSWPGNVRELQNCIESALNMASVDDSVLLVTHLPSQFHSRDAAPPINGRMIGLNLRDALKEAEKHIIATVLETEKNNRNRAARRLGISTTTLWRRMRELDMFQD
ncbi:MAG: sigma 54-interacting transcriptional regulator [Veillonellales bacterium]